LQLDDFDEQAFSICYNRNSCITFVNRSLNGKVII